MSTPSFFIGPEQEPTFPVGANVVATFYRTDPDGGAPWESVPERSFSGMVIDSQPEEGSIIMEMHTWPEGFHNAGTPKFNLESAQQPRIVEVTPRNSDPYKLLTRFVFRHLEQN